MLNEFDRRQEIPDSEKEVIHLLRQEPEKGATVVCFKCGLAFKSNAATWTTNASAHGFNRFKAYKSCSPNYPKV